MDDVTCLSQPARAAVPMMPPIIKSLITSAERRSAAARPEVGQQESQPATEPASPACDKAAGKGQAATPCWASSSDEAFKRVVMPESIGDTEERAKQFCRLLLMRYAVKCGNITQEQIPCEYRALYEASVFQHLEHVDLGFSGDFIALLTGLRQESSETGSQRDDLKASRPNLA